jgi:hypothetical protein
VQAEEKGECRKQRQQRVKPHLVGCLIAAWLLTAVACTFPSIHLPATTTPTVTPTPSATEGVVMDVGTQIIMPTQAQTSTAILTNTPAVVIVTATEFFTETPAPTETLPPPMTMPYGDSSDVLKGACFAYLQTLDGQQISFNSQGDLATFFDNINRSKKCPELAPAQTFDFSARQLIGTVITGQGCGFVLAYDHTETDDSAHTRTIIIRAATSGDCPYGLVQPMLLSVERTDYKLQVRVAR